MVSNIHEDGNVTTGQAEINDHGHGMDESAHYSDSGNTKNMHNKLQ